MLIRVEPKEFFMSTVYLIFNRGQAEPEDAEIKEYLAQRELEPKREFDTTYQEQACQVWQFGGCYLGNHLHQIADIQQGYLEAEMLALEIPRLLKQGADAALLQTADALPDARLQELLGLLVREFHRESAFGTDEAGHVKVTLEPGVIQQRFRELLTA